MVVRPLVVDSGGRLAYQPLPRRHQHAEGFDGIETDGGRGKPRLARNVRRTRLQPGEQRQGRWWPRSRLVARVGLQYKRRQLLVGPLVTLG